MTEHRVTVAKPGLNCDWISRRDSSASFDTINSKTIFMI